MSGVTGAVIAGAAVVGAGATAYGASASSSAAKKAAAENRRAVEETNRLNYQMFREGRGEGGNAFLPLYMGDYETKLARDAQGIYDVASIADGTPQQQLERYKAIVERLRPSFDAGTGVVDAIYSGALTEERLRSAQPVAAARRAVAGAQKQGILEGLSARLNQIKADSQRQGFVGGGSFASNRLLDATVRGRQDAAIAGAAAELENQTEAQRIRDSGIDLKLRSLDLPGSRAQQAMAFESLPGEFLAGSYARRLKPFEFFRLGPNQFRFDAPPPVTAVPGTGQIIAAGVGQLAGTLGNYYTNQALINQMQQAQSPYGYGYDAFGQPRGVAYVPQNMPVNTATYGSPTYSAAELAMLGGY